MLRCLPARQAAQATPVSTVTSGSVLSKSPEVDPRPFPSDDPSGSSDQHSKGLVFPSPAGTQTIVHAAHWLLSLTQVSTQCLRQVTWLLASCNGLVPLCTFCICPLLILLRDIFDMRVDHPSKLIPFSSPVIQSTLEFWGSWAKCVSGSPSSTSLTNSHPHGGYIHLWMWGDLQSSVGPHGVVECSVFSPYQLSRAGALSLALKRFQGSAVWHTHSSSDGQHHGDALSEHGRRDQVQVPGHQGLGEYSVVSKVRDFSDCSQYISLHQHRGRSPLFSSSRESSLVGTLHRIISGHHGDFSLIFGVQLH